MSVRRSQVTTREVTFVSSPAGIFLETGTWFEIREEDLRQYARGVLNVYPLERLLADADVWLRSPRTLGLMSLPLLLLVLPTWLSVIITLCLFSIWYVYGPSLVNHVMLAILRVLDSVVVQGLTYIVLLSLLAMQGDMIAMWTGLVLFVLFRWGVLDRIATKVLAPGARAIYSLPLPDQVLRGIIFRRAIASGVAMPEFAGIEKSIRDRWT
jgi:hypothetical protein